MIRNLRCRSAESGLAAIVTPCDFLQRQSLADHLCYFVKKGLLKVRGLWNPVLGDRLVQRKIGQIGAEVLPQPKHADIRMNEILLALELLARLLLALANHHRDG